MAKKKMRVKVSNTGVKTVNMSGKPKKAEVLANMGKKLPKFGSKMPKKKKK